MCRRNALSQKAHVLQPAPPALEYLPEILVKLHPDLLSEGINMVSAYGEGYVAINGVRHVRSLLVPASGAVEAWGAARFDDLLPRDFERIVTLAIEILILGTGSTHRFAHPSWLRSLSAGGVGVESMSTAAACRTYNILAAEGRKVAGAFIIEPQH